MKAIKIIIIAALIAVVAALGTAEAGYFDATECPASVVWQAQFKQGTGTYERIGNTYFCY